MEFLDINLMKDLCLLLHANQSLSTGGSLRKPDSALVLKIHAKNPRNKKTGVYLFFKGTQELEFFWLRF
jgi:hypothetical protein